MVKKLTADDWDDIQSKAPARYYIQSVEDGVVRVKFDTEIVKCENGEEDLIGNKWTHDWAKCEAKVFVKDIPKIYSMGGDSWPFMRVFIAECKQKGVGPDKIPGSIFDIAKTGDWDYEVNYIGREGEGNVVSEIKLDDDKLQDIKNTINELKKNSPDLLKGAEKKSDFLKLIYIRSKVKPSETEKYMETLEEEGILLQDDGKISIL